jgi:hypothetical protein
MCKGSAPATGQTLSHPEIEARSKIDPNIVAAVLTATVIFITCSGL